MMVEIDRIRWPHLPLSPETRTLRKIGRSNQESEQPTASNQSTIKDETEYEVPVLA
jgi:hypothetical protein